MSTPTPADSVAAHRSRLRAFRATLSTEAVAEYSDAATERIRELPWWEHAHNVAVYRSFGGEIDPSPFAREARAAGTVTSAPRLAGDRLEFATFDDATRWTPNRYGIDEPVGTDNVPVTALDLVVVPAVAVDALGNRLGMGAGWYDRTFEWLTTSPRPASVVLVAAVYDEQVVDELTPATWDVRMDAIVTPTRTVIVRS